MHEALTAFITGFFSLAGAVVTGSVTLLVALIGGFWALWKYYHQYKMKNREPFLEWQFLELQKFVEASARILTANENTLRELKNELTSARSGTLRIVGSGDIVMLAELLESLTPNDYGEYLVAKKQLTPIVGHIAIEAKKIIQRNWGIDDGYMR